MPLPKIYPESVVARFEAGTLERVKVVLRENETRAEFLRTIVLEEVARRTEGAAAGVSARISLDGDGAKAPSAKRKKTMDGDGAPNGLNGAPNGSSGA